MDANDKRYDWCYPGEGEAFPEPELYSGVIIFGGAGSVNDETSIPWIKSELAFVEQLLKNDIPLFGICLGGQMLAKVMGAPVTPHPDAIREVGFHPIEPTLDSGLFLESPLHVMQWHSEGFDVPTDAELLATGELFPNQAFRIGSKHYAVQFHPEVNPDALTIWHERNKRRDTGRLDEATRQAQMLDARRYDAENTQWLDAFLRSWTT